MANITIPGTTINEIAKANANPGRPVEGHLWRRPNQLDALVVPNNRDEIARRVCEFMGLGCMVNPDQFLDREDPTKSYGYSVYFYTSNVGVRSIPYTGRTANQYRADYTSWLRSFFSAFNGGPVTSPYAAPIDRMKQWVGFQDGITGFGQHYHWHLAKQHHQGDALHSIFPTIVAVHSHTLNDQNQPTQLFLPLLPPHPDRAALESAAAQDTPPEDSE